MKLSGFEPLFDPRPWINAVNSDNCYDYAIGDYEHTRVVKSTPGNRAGLSASNINIKSCKDLQKRILSDNPKTVYKCKNPGDVCRRGYYKIMNFVTSDGSDFHFYKQVRGVKYKVKTGDTRAKLAAFFKVKPSVIPRVLVPGRVITFPCNLWAHKQGWGAGPILTDARGKTIKDPRKASRKYPGLHYDTFCGAFCVSANRAVSGDQSLPGLRAMTRRNQFHRIGSRS
jgi:hypothetical protein